MLRLVALTPETLAQFAEFLGRSDFGGCFCAVWTAFGEDWSSRCADPTRPNLETTSKRVQRGEHVGYLVYEGQDLVAWTGAGPKQGFPLLQSKLGSRLSPMSPEVWSLGCVAIAKAARGGGLSQRVVESVIAEAKRSGARALEAYPTDPWDEPRSYRGAASTYLRLGFEQVARDPAGEGAILLLRLPLGD
jgi:GNAT superfamily N-acetyltransferase